MPDTMSAERMSILRAYGAQLELTPGASGMPGAIKRAQEIVDLTPGAVMLGQFENPANAAAHEMTTAPEIHVQMEGKLDAFSAGIGTGGTVTGTARGLKRLGCEAKIIGVEPYESPYLTPVSYTHLDVYKRQPWARDEVHRRSTGPVSLL